MPSYGVMQIGDLVIPVDQRELLFSTPDKVEFEDDPIEMVWYDVVGIVLEIIAYDPPREYTRVKVMVDDTTGWTSSDCLRVVSSPRARRSNAGTRRGDVYKMKV